jgi:hypothetical protein
MRCVAANDDAAAKPRPRHQDRLNRAIDDVGIGVERRCDFGNIAPVLRQPVSQQPTSLLPARMSRRTGQINGPVVKLGGGNLRRLELMSLCKKTVTLFCASAFMATSAYAQQCQCIGPRLDHYNGGDKAPLSWSFEPYLAKPGAGDQPPWICYQKLVKNSSSNEVRSIHWEAADFYRKSIAPNEAISSCPTIPGEMRSDPHSGPLYYGVNSDHYDTTVREPKDGWWTASNSAVPNVSVRLLQTPPIQSTFVVVPTWHDHNGVAYSSPAYIHISSSAFRADNKTTLTLELFNFGEEAVRVLINLPDDGVLSKELPLLTNATLLRPKQIVKFMSTTEKQVTAQATTVIFYDELGKEIIAVDGAGFFGLSEGRREIDTEKMWQSLR